MHSKSHEFGNDSINHFKQNNPRIGEIALSYLLLSALIFTQMQQSLYLFLHSLQGACPDSRHIISPRLLSGQMPTLLSAHWTCPSLSHPLHSAGQGSFRVLCCVLALRSMTNSSGCWVKPKTLLKSSFPVSQIRF